MDYYARLSQIPLRIESHRLEGRLKIVASGFERRTTSIWLEGAGESGVGEDVTYESGDQVRFQRNGGGLELDGEYTLDGFSRHLDDLDLFSGTQPESSASADYRRWAFESAALDLALRQCGRSLFDILERETRPVTFVVSLGLGARPTVGPLLDLRREYPGVRFKLDASSAWNEALMLDLEGLDAVDIVDLKGAYKGTPVDTPPDPVLYDNVARLLPRVWIEDPALTPGTQASLSGFEERITWDAPIHSVGDIRSLSLEPRMLNIKPSRFGTLARLFEAYAFCEARGISMYGGGQFELGPGRGQIQYLASMFHPDAPNDVAPTIYNDPEPKTEAEQSPLQPRPEAAGFRWRNTG